MTHRLTNEERARIEAAFDIEEGTRPWAKRDARRKAGAARKKALGAAVEHGLSYRQALSRAFGRKFGGREVR